MAGCARHGNSCGRCDRPLDFAFTMAFQPLVDIELGRVYGHEALVRGSHGEPAATILALVDQHNRYRFDQACRIKAIELASQLGSQELLSINFLPNAVYEPEACMQATLAAAERVGWPLERLCFEVIETEHVRDRRHLQEIVGSYRRMGLKVALDDFGTGHANLDLLIDIVPDILKLDRQLVHGVAGSRRRQIIIDQLIRLAAEFETTLVAEGIETLEDARWLYQRGIVRQQGYWFARPIAEQLPRCPDTRIQRVRGEH